MAGKHETGPSWQWPQHESISGGLALPSGEQPLQQRDTQAIQPAPPQYPEPLSPLPGESSNQYLMRLILAQLVSSGLALVSAFGADLTGEQVAAITSIASILLTAGTVWATMRGKKK